MENEKETEWFLCREVKRQGGKAYKFVSPGNAGVPDRIVIFPGGRVCFIELKSEGKKSSNQQKARQKELADLGCRVYQDIDTKAKVREVITNELQSPPVSALLYHENS